MKELNEFASKFWLGFQYSHTKEEYIELLQWAELISHEYLKMTFNEDVLKMNVEEKEVLKNWAFYELTPFLPMVHEVYLASPDAVIELVNESKYFNAAYQNCMDTSCIDYLRAKSNHFLYRKGRNGILEKIVM